MDDTQKHFEGWAVVELFGHGKAIGFVTTEYFGTACLFRVDTPGRDEREWILEKPEWGRDPDNLREMMLPVGVKVKRPAMPAHSRLVGPGSIFAINPCTQEVALRQLERDELRPLIAVELPENLRTKELLPGESDEDNDLYAEEIA